MDPSFAAVPNATVTVTKPKLDSTFSFTPVASTTPPPRDIRQMEFSARLNFY